MQRYIGAFGLFLGAPLIAEYLLGNMSITMLGALVVLAPMYGGGALLIREAARRDGRGWPAIFILALAYGVLEEGLMMQSLFNPNFLGLNQDLLGPAHLHSLGIGVWWTVFVLTLHTVWSIPVPIAIAEGLVPAWADKPWLKPFDVIVVAALFLAACLSITNFTIRRDPSHFVASHGQLACAALIVVALIVVAFTLPRPGRSTGSQSAPGCWAVGLASLLAGSAFLTIPRQWGWRAVCLYLALDAAAILMVRAWSRRSSWRLKHRVSLAGGAALAYAWHSFIETPAAGGPSRFGNAVFACGLLIVLGAVALKLSQPKNRPFNTIEIK